MVRLSETLSKAQLSERGIQVPDGGVATTASEAAQIADSHGPVAVKAQIPVTDRRAKGLVRFADGATEARTLAADLLGTSVEGTAIETLRVEDRIECTDEWYAGITIDSATRSPRIVVSTRGGTGIETVKDNHPDDIVSSQRSVREAFRPHHAYDLLRQLDVHGPLLRSVGNVIKGLWETFSELDARSAEINPIGLTPDDAIALDARLTVDDAAIGRHPELDVEVAREFGRPPTDLERIAYEVERDDYRGTFYFVQTERDIEAVARGEGYVGFHGAGGGGAMMSLDALTGVGLKAPNYTDTSGNPPASKVYKAARIILSQPGVEGYFYSGSGAASQEMDTTARGLMRAFVDEEVTVPIVLRLGGNAEDAAVGVVTEHADKIPGPIEAYGGDHSARDCAHRLLKLIDEPDLGDPLPRTVTVHDPPPDEANRALEIDEDLTVPGLETYREKLLELGVVQQLREDSDRWVF